MKHIFMINPKAGKTDRVKEIKEKLEPYAGKIDFEIYVTKSQGDATVYIKEYLSSHDKNETYRFYSCGGDGTLHDVCNGVVGYNNVEIACYACGSGNDFIKNFGNADDFKNIDLLINGQAKSIDVLKVDDSYCINILSMGLDGEVTYQMNKFRRMPLISGSAAYNLAALQCLLFKLNSQMKLTLDGTVVHDDKAVLVAVANGYCYGGGFYCAPKAVVDDGLIDVCLVKAVKKYQAAGFMKIYKKGDHLTDPKLSQKIIYQKAKHVVIESPKPIAYQVDGETFKKAKVEISIIPNAIRFVLPPSK